MKLITVVKAYNALDTLADNDSITARVSYWIAKFISKTQDDVKFYQHEVTKLFDKYGTKNKDGTMTVPSDVMEEFTKKVEELEATEAQDPGIRFKLSDLTGEMKISPKNMYPLLDFIDEEGNP